MTWVCYNCGKEVEDTFEVKCPHCGKKILTKKRPRIVREVPTD